MFWKVISFFWTLIVVAGLSFTGYILVTKEGPYPSINVIAEVDEHSIVTEKKEKVLDKLKPDIKIIKVKESICGKKSRFKRFNRIHWPYYVKNECGPLRGRDCCNTIDTDTGGYTCYGVSIKNNERFFKTVDKIMKDKKMSDKDIEPFAKLQIFSKYFKGSKISELHYSAVQPVFDYSVHSGISRAVKLLQKNIGSSPDGNIGPMTIEASKRFNMKKYNDVRANFVRTRKIYKKYPKGMEVRLSNNIRQSKEAYEILKKECSK